MEQTDVCFLHKKYIFMFDVRVRSCHFCFAMFFKFPLMQQLLKSYNLYGSLGLKCAYLELSTNDRIIQDTY